MTVLEDEDTTTESGLQDTIVSRIRHTHISICFGKPDRKKNTAPSFVVNVVILRASVIVGRTDWKGGDKVNYESSFG